MSFEQKVSRIKEIFDGYIISEPKEVVKKGYRGIYIDVYVLRKIISPVIFRNTDRTELTYTTLSNRLHVEVYSRKFKAPEKITGLKILKEFNKLPSGYFYNSLEDESALRNPVSVLYGDTVTGKEAEAPAIPSRILYTWALSPQRYEDVAEEKTHNALSEMGTMWDPKEGKLRETLFKNIYMNKGHLLQLITFYNVVPEELIFGIGNILHTSTYGAEDSVNQRNIKNDILLIACSKPFENPVTPYEVIENLTDDEISKMTNDDQTKRILQNKLRDLISKYAYVKILSEKETTEVLEIVRSIYGDRELLGRLVEVLVDYANGFISALGVEVEKAKKTKKRS
ncbi:MAG: type I-D CRISPR-associated protein Cas7/Csc2 [Deltaproteobacteria bacterium]|nr:MAG: type I-D CRISPR-associated protein Cas7/Csc2 [Deltaproteobacteria bacterium]